MKKILLTGYIQDDPIIDYLLAVFNRYQSELSTKYQIERQHTLDLTELVNIVSKTDAEQVFIITDWKNTAESTLSVFKQLHALPQRPALIYLDHFDQSSSPFFNILPYVDLYVKKQIFKEPLDYNKPMQGNYIFSDFMATEMNIDLNGWEFGSPVPEDHIHKLFAGWNLVAADHIHNMIFPAWYEKLLKNSKKDIDLHCKVGMGSEEVCSWYYHHRKQCVEHVDFLKDEFTLATNLTAPGMLSKRKYWQEVSRSKIGLSASGFGEITDRDFAYVCHDVLVMKPDTSHLETHPNFYIDGENYVALKWDLSDFEEKFRYYIARPDEIDRINKNARQCLQNFYTQKAFLPLFDNIVNLAATHKNG